MVSLKQLFLRAKDTCFTKTKTNPILQLEKSFHKNKIKKICVPELWMFFLLSLINHLTAS